MNCREIFELRARGLTIREIGEVVGRATSCVHKILTARIHLAKTVPLALEFAGRLHGRKRLSLEQREEILRRRDAGHSYERIARRLGIGLSQARDYVNGKTYR